MPDGQDGPATGLPLLSIGVDIGGTFTDFLMIDPRTGTFRTAKLPTTLDDRSAGFLAGLSKVGADPSAIAWLVHGTTAGTNAVLERKGAVTGLVTTAGFRDVLELGRRTRPHPWGLTGEFEPLIPRPFRLEVPERMDAAGRVVTPLDEEALAGALRTLLGMGAEALVIHFLHSYANPAHEERALAIAREIWPTPHVVAGHRVVSEIREFERGSTAAIHGMIRPVVSTYVEETERALRRAGFSRDLLIMQGNGGIMAASVVGDHAVQTVMSGPAAGALAAAALGRAAGYPNVITGDMGGTSFDTAAIVAGVPVVSAEKDLAYGVPVRVPMIDIHTIGAGGGSIARVGPSGILTVGPDSAGATPGPIGFRRGGTEPTVTDANLVLGRLNPAAITGTSTAAQIPEIARVFAERIGGPLGLDAVEAAEAVIAVAVADLAGAIRLVSIEKGHDPRDFALMPFGGAGPLHAAALAREIGLPTVVVPRFPGLTSALGCVLADVRHDHVATVNKPLRQLDVEPVEAVLAGHRADGLALLAREGVATDRIVVTHEADLLYRGQSHVVRLPFTAPGIDTAAIESALVAHYRSRFGIVLEEMTPMLAAVRTTVIGRREPLDLAVFRPPETGAATPHGRRPVRLGGAWVDTPVFLRDDIGAGATLEGPAVVEQMDATLVIEPGWTAEVDRVGNLVLRDRTAPPAGERSPAFGRATADAERELQGRDVR